MVLLVVGAAILYFGLGMTQVNRYGSVEISGWVTVGSLVELGGLLMTGIGLHRLLQNLESHFHLARQRK